MVGAQTLDMDMRRLTLTFTYLGLAEQLDSHLTLRLPDREEELEWSERDLPNTYISFLEQLNC